MSDTTRQPDAVIQELWRVKDAAFEAAGRDPQQFVRILREKSEGLRQRLNQPAPALPVQSSVATP